MNIIGNTLSAGGGAKPFDGALLRVTTNVSQEGTAIAFRGSYNFTGKVKHYNSSSGNCTYYFFIPATAFSTSSFIISIETTSYSGTGTIVISTAKEYSLSVTMNAK